MLNVKHLRIAEPGLAWEHAPVRTLGDVIRRERAKKRMSALRLAREAGLDKGTVNRLETGKLQRAPYAGTLQAIAEALDLTVDELQRLQQDDDDRIGYGPTDYSDRLTQGERPLTPAEIRKSLTVESGAGENPPPNSSAEVDGLKDFVYRQLSKLPQDEQDRWIAELLRRVEAVSQDAEKRGAS